MPLTLICLHRFILPQRKSPSQCTIIVPCIIDQFRSVQVPDLGRPGKGPRIPVHGVFQCLYKSGLYLRVIVQQNNICRFAALDPGIDRLAESVILLKTFQLYLRKLLLHQFSAAVHRTIIHDDDMRSLSCQRAETVFNVLHAIVIWNDYGRPDLFCHIRNQLLYI